MESFSPYLYTNNFLLVLFEIANSFNYRAF